MSFQEKNSKQKFDSDEPYDLMNGLNIEFKGFLTLELANNYENSRQSLNDYLSKYTNNIECQKVDCIGTLYEIRCRKNNKRDAINTIKEHLSTILVKEGIKHLSIGISISLAFFNHKKPDHYLTDPIDYEVMKVLSSKLFDILPKLLEPVEPQFIMWDGETWSDRSC